MDQGQNKLEKPILYKPIVTEKAMDESQKGKYTFKVNLRSSKPEIKKVVEKTFKVKVIKIGILNYTGKKRTRARTKGRTASWKKAIITLKKGDKIELFEGV